MNSMRQKVHIDNRIKIYQLLLITFIFFSQPFLLFSEPHVAKIGVVSMEATHNFKSSLISKINEVKPLIEEAGRQNLDLVAIPEAYFRGIGLMVDIQDLSESIVLDSIKFGQALFGKLLDLASLVSDEI